jgi:hypothetical protein
MSATGLHSGQQPNDDAAASNVSILNTALGGEFGAVAAYQLAADRWCIAAAAAQPWMLSLQPFCDDEWIEVGSISSIEEGAMRWRISWVLMCR